MDKSYGKHEIINEYKILIGNLRNLATFEGRAIKFPVSIEMMILYLNRCVSGYKLF
jgi:hypothetical protein